MPLSDDERSAARTHPGLTRALQLIALGLRNEGVREWNFSLRGMNDRALLAAADRACEREVWDRCINTSDRTRNSIDIEQRFPMPFRNEVVAFARELGLDAAYVYGLIRQESRFIMDARSSVGASGLMQIMPATARWTARKIGLPYSPDLITDRITNLKLGTNYLKLVLDDFDGSQALAAAAYNAGPSRSRRWREGATIEPAIWAENIPFTETRDYVKKVLSNATVYAALLAGQKQPPAAIGPAALPVGSAPGVVPVAYRSAGAQGAASAASAAARANSAQAASATAESGAASVAEAAASEPVTEPAPDAASSAGLQFSATAMVAGTPASPATSSSAVTSAASAPPLQPAADVAPPVLRASASMLLPSLRARLGAMIGPRDNSASPPDKDLP